jgi:hypothetical protein
VIECGPTARLDAVKVAPPPLSGLLPSGVAPSKKVTVPVGVPTEEETVAVYVTAFCASAGFAEDSSPIAGVTLLTCRLRFVDQGVKRRMARGGGGAFPRARIGHTGQTSDIGAMRKMRRAADALTAFRAGAVEVREWNCFENSARSISLLMP